MKRDRNRLMRRPEVRQTSRLGGSERKEERQMKRDKMRETRRIELNTEKGDR